jgi:hypothetical protein
LRPYENTSRTASVALLVTTTTKKVLFWALLIAVDFLGYENACHIGDLEDLGVRVVAVQRAIAPMVVDAVEPPLPLRLGLTQSTEGPGTGTLTNPHH